MTDTADHDTSAARSVFAGLVPSAPLVDPAHHRPVGERSRLSKGLYSTVPIILAGSMAMSLNLTGPVEPANAKRPLKPKAATSDLGKTIREAMAAANAAIKTTTASVIASAPTTYRVVAGDTVSEIAGRYGLSTASVLALNGLGWSSLIFPGQELKLTKSGSVAPVVEAPTTATSSNRYTIVAGDTISAIAERFGVSTLSVLTANGLGWSSIIYPGQTLAIPGLFQDADAPAPDSAPVVAPEVPAEETPVVDSTPVAEAPAPVEPPVVEAPPAPAPPPAPANGSYTIISGDTLSGIAAKFGISTQALLDANGLDWSSVIFSGRTLVIPGVTAPASSGGGNVTYLNDEMRANASVIIAVGRELGVPDYGIVIALATAMQESSMRNLDWGDRDSVGLFQQRPSSGWGSVEQLTTPSHAARLFYGGPSNPNRGYTRGLLDIGGWQSMSVTQAAQAVQISAYPDAYAKWEASARAWFAELG